MSEWKKVKIGDVCKIVKGTTGIAGAEPGKYPLVVTAVERKTCSTYQFDCEAVCIPLVSSSGHGKKSLNNVHFQSGKFALGTILCAVIPNNSDELDARYLHQYLQFYKDTVLVPLMKGAANVSLSMKDIAGVSIPLPPIQRQRELAGMFVMLQQKQKELFAEFEKQTEYAKQLRQNILQEAIEGKLTADWRKQHPVQKGNPDYDAQALLDCLQQKKESLKKDPLVKREKIRTPVGDTEKEFSIPNNWIWIRMGELCYPITKGTTPDVHEIKADGEIPYLKMFNIVNQKLDFDYRPQYISKKVHDEKLTRSKVYPNDVIMNIVGPPMGKIAMVTDEFPEWNLNQAMAIFRGYDISINPYIYVFLNSMIWFKYVHTLGVVGQENMSLEQCKDIAVALPPLAEQKEIVARVEKHLEAITQLETQIATRETTTKQLMQSILKNAFEEK